MCRWLLSVRCLVSVEKGEQNYQYNSAWYIFVFLILVEIYPLSGAGFTKPLHLTGLAD